MRREQTILGLILEDDDDDDDDGWDVINELRHPFKIPVVINYITKSQITIHRFRNSYALEGYTEPRKN